MTKELAKCGCMPRRKFMKTSAGLTVGLISAANLPYPVNAQSMAQNVTLSTTTPAPKEASYWLTNVLIEKGFTKSPKGQVIATATETVNLLIENGKVSQINRDTVTSPLPRYDLKGYLALPSFADMHTHLDKGFFGGPWQASTPFQSVQQRISEEEQFLVSFIENTTQRAEALLNLIANNGVTHVRIQCNVDPVQKLQNMVKVLQATDTFHDRIDFELVAFPQHGLIKHTKLLEAALQQGFNIMGGLDPHIIDKDLHRSLNTMMELAVKYDVPIDMHLHEQGEQGASVIDTLATLTEQANWQNKVTISHAYCLGQLNQNRLDEVLNRIKDAKISIISTAPIDIEMPPAEALQNKGIPLSLASDCIHDHWSVYGSGSMLERASRLGEINGWNDEYQLNRALKYITRGITPLNEKGDQVWPKTGIEANMTILKASCSAEAVARRNPVKACFFRGKPSVWKI